MTPHTAWRRAAAVAIAMLVLASGRASGQADALAPADAAVDGYVANKDNLRTFFDALGGALGKPVIVSRLASRKTISGNFDFSEPRALLQRLSTQLGLVWYHDGQVIHVYDASELRSVTVALQNVSFDALVS